MPARPEPDLTEFRRRLGHEFKDPALLRRAFAHRSWCAEVGGEPSNERLEFLGDAVLGWVIADLAYARHDELAEGKLTDLRKSVVNASTLAEVAQEIGIGECLLLGKGEDAAGGRTKPSILSDALEAVLGAVYIDGGAAAAFELIERLFAGRMSGAAQRLDRLDYKTVLQELTARLHDTAPVYVISDTGPDHQKQFFATVIVAGAPMGKGEGRSKKIAEQAAAEQAWMALSNAAAAG
ncbi:MAG: ribonuclease III [Actinomycetota bacterium]|nr:ribonuclease III [Actinomycetota bacterium]